MVTLDEGQWLLLELLSTKTGVIFLRGEEAIIATSRGMERFVAVGPSGSSKTVAAQITDEGRYALASRP